MKRFTTIMICLVLIMSLVSCGNKSDVSGNDKEGVFTELIPSEIYNYTFEGECYTSKLTNVEIIRETTKDDLYDGTAKLTLDDDNLTRTVELTLHGRKFDKGGWNLESKSVESEVINEWKEDSVKKYAKKQHEWSEESCKQTFDSVSKDSNGNFSCKTNVSFNSNYLDVTGTIEYILSSMPKIESQFNYYINNIDRKEIINVDWKINGRYHTNDNSFTITLIKRDAETFDWEASERWNHAEGGYGYYRDQGTETIKSIAWSRSMNKTEREFVITVEYPNYALKFTPSILYASETTMGSIPIKYNELVKEE